MVMLPSLKTKGSFVHCLYITILAAYDLFHSIYLSFHKSHLCHERIVFNVVTADSLVACERLYREKPLQIRYS